MRFSLNLQLDLSKHPRFEVTEHNRLLWFGGVAIIFSVLYGVTNRFLIFEPRVFEYVPFENAIPFLPWTTWIYISDYIFPFIIGYLLKDKLVLTRVTVAFFLMSLLVNLCFLLFPVKYVRELYPLGGGQELLRYIRELDNPTNCFPSAHVSIIWLTTLALFRERPRLAWFFCVWALLICISTLTTKQHYIVDVVAGAVLGLFCYVFIEKLIIKTPPNRTKDQQKPSDSTDTYT